MIDQNLEFEEKMTVQEIVNVVLGQPEVEDNEGVDKISEPIVTSTEAINGLENAKKGNQSGHKGGCNQVSQPYLRHIKMVCNHHKELRPASIKYIQQKDLEADSQTIKNILKLKREISYRSIQEARQCRIDE